MNSFGLGFIAGFIANWVFAMITRLLPPTWVRYEVRIGEPRKNVSSVGEEWMSPVTIIPPRWKRALMEPLKEYLIAHVRFDNSGSWYISKWATGDFSDSRLRADGGMTVHVFLLSRLGHGGFWGVTDSYGETKLKVVPKITSVRIVRSLDNSIAKEEEFTVLDKDNEITSIHLSKNSSQKKSS